MTSPQVAPSEFAFKMPDMTRTEKFTNKEKEKWVDKKPFFAGFNQTTKNKHTTMKGQEEPGHGIRAGGYNPVSRQDQK